MRLVLAFACAALGLLAHPGAAQEAAAQDATVALPSAAILTLDDERLFTGSAFGQAVIARQDADSKALIDENRRIEAALEAEEKDLTNRRALMPREEFAPLSDAFNEKVEGIRKAQDAKTRALQRKFDADRQRFLEVARPILAEVMAERGALAIIDSRAVFIGFENIDITDAAIVRLDAAMDQGRLTPGAP